MLRALPLAGDGRRWNWNAHRPPWHLHVRPWILLRLFQLPFGRSRLHQETEDQRDAARRCGRHPGHTRGVLEIFHIFWTDLHELRVFFPRFLVCCRV